MALRDAGWTVVNVACGLGRAEQRARRESEARDAAARARFELRIPQSPVAMSSGDDLESARSQLLEIVRNELNGLHPAVVVSPSPHDRHPAHELVAAVVRDALAEHGDDAPRWWMWGLWDQLPLPTLATAFGADRLEEILTALAAYGGELSRNDYRRLVKARAEMSASLGSELVFGFGSRAPARIRFVELLTEAQLANDHWMLGSARWLDPLAPLAESGEAAIDSWIGGTTETDRYGMPGSQGKTGTMPGDTGPTFDEEERERLWELTLHEDEVFNQRHALFLIAEAMLAVTYATGLDAGENPVAGMIAVAGLLLTTAWLYVSLRHGGKVEQVQARAKAVLPDYREIAESTSTPTKPWLRMHSRTVAGILVPILIAILWVALLVPRILPP